MTENRTESQNQTNRTVSLFKILPVLAIILTIFGFAHWFSYLTITRTNGDSVILAVIYAVGLFSMPLGFLAARSKQNTFFWVTWFGYIWMGFFAINLLFSTIELISNIFFEHGHSYWVLIATIIISIWALYKGLRFPDLVEHQISGPKEIQNFKIAQISDLHIGMLKLNKTWLEKVVDEINKQKPDMIAITGDLVEGDFHKVSQMLEPLKKLQSTCGVFYITGNHEYIHPGDWEAHLRELNIISLHNENRTIEFNNQKILIAGVPDRMAPRFMREIKSNPDFALKSNEATIYKILLAHQPSSVYDIKTEVCDLMLTGHTHGGQIFPFHLAVRIAQPMISNFKKFGQTLVFNHQGTGFWGPPMRWFTRSEIVILSIT